MDPLRKVNRSSSSAAYKKRRSTALGAHKQDNAFQVTNYRDKPNGSEQVQVTLERVVGLTANTNSQIALDPQSGTVAYAAGCVAVLLGRQFQENIINASKKAITALAFSPDGRYLAIGESGHAPAVRVYEISSSLQIGEFSGHKFGVTCVAFSPNNKYLVSIGTQHDMVTNVWNWRQGIKVASNKISSKVNGLAFSSDGTTFITIGVRHVKYWFLDESKRKTTIQNKNETVPLLGRNGLLGDQKTNVFVDVVCGKGIMSNSIYVISQNGTLCQFIDRQISKTVELKTIRAYCLQASESLIIVGCANGVIRVFDAESLHYLYTLQKPHPLGIDVLTDSVAVAWPTNDFRYPDTLGMAFNELDMTLTVVYSDHSLYKWDLSRLPQIGRISAALYHSSCVWAIDVLPPHDTLPVDTFITCSSDDTIRFWNLHPSSFTDMHQKKPSFNSELLNIIYTDPSLGSLSEQEYNTDKPDIYESRNGVKCICTSPDGHHLASGDQIGNIRIHDICAMSQLHMIEAHESGILCLEYSDFNTGSKYLVSGSRDRLIHIFDADRDYEHLQTLSDHSSSICSIKLIPTSDGIQLISCGNDKSLLFRVASFDQEELNFQLKQNLISKTTPHDMIIDPSGQCAATACQDRMIRLYNTQTAKQKRNYKGSLSDDGFLLKLAIDCTGTFLAASCSDKSIAILDFRSGEIVATLVGHSEVITGLQFTNDCCYLISVSADGCMFFWRLDERLVERMFSAPTLKRSNSEIISHPKPDVTLVTPHQGQTRSSLKSGKSLGNLTNEEDFDETTFVVKKANSSSVLPAWAKESTMNGSMRGKWDKDRATPVMHSLKNGQLHLSPDSARLANGSGNIIPIAVQSQVTVVPGDDEGATDDEDSEVVFRDHFLPKHSKNQLNLSLNNNAHGYKDLPTPDSIYYRQASLDDDEEFTITHRSGRIEDEKSSTSDGMSHHTMESEDDGASTARSTPASSIPSTPMSPTSILTDVLLQDSSEDNKSGASSNPNSSRPQRSARKESQPKTVTINLPPQGERKRPHQQAGANGRESGVYPHFSSTESLTSTEDLIPDTASRTLTTITPELSDKQMLTDNIASREANFSEIDKLCTALRSNLSTAQKLLNEVEDEDSSEKDYLVETLRDVCDGFHQMLPPTPQFEAIVHQTLHQFLHMNRNQKLIDRLNVDQSDKG